MTWRLKLVKSAASVLMLLTNRIVGGGGGTGLSIHTATPARTPAITATLASGSARFHNGRAATDGTTTGAGAGSVGSAWMNSISQRTSPIACSRSRRDFARQRRRSRDSRGSSVAGIAVHSGSRARTDAMMSVTDSPGNACRPVRSSYNTQPNENTSLRWSVGRPFACSGDMYAAVPRMTPAIVPFAVSVGDSDKSWCRSWCALDRLRQPEVEHLDLAVRRDLDVGRLEIAMDDAALVRRFERVGHLPGDGERLGNRERAGLEAIRERVAFDELHHEEMTPGGFLHSVERGDVRVIERGECLGFALETGDAIFVAGGRVGQHLDRDFAAELGVAGAIDLAHSRLRRARRRFRTDEAASLE